MNTFRIYEEFRDSLGEAAARSLAATLGTMFEELKDTVTKEDFRILRESIDANVSRLDTALTRLAEAQERSESRIEALAAAQARTEAKVTELAEAQARTESKIAELAEGQARLVEAQTRTEAKIAELAAAQARTEAKIAELAAAQARTEAKVAELADAQARTESKVAELADAQARTESKVAELADAQREMTVALQRLTIRTDAVVGRTFELQFRDRLTAYLGRFLRRGRLLPNDELLEKLEPFAANDEIDDFLRADAVASGLIDGAPSYVVVEVSSTGDVEDIVRAERRAKILRKAGLTAVPLVACDAISPESLAFARLSAVRVWCNGSMVEAAA
jgi:DNA repair exonuclease SbcCD ATPase subunit